MYSLMLAASDYRTVAVLALVVLALTALMLAAAHILGPRRHGPVKDSPYESGMTPITDTHRRFHVRFYLVAVMSVVFGVEVLFLYPWAVVFPQLQAGLNTPDTATGPAAETARWATDLAAGGYGPGFMLASILVFFGLLAVGFVYEWRKGVFRWD